MRRSILLTGRATRTPAAAITPVRRVASRSAFAAASSPYTPRMSPPVLALLTRIWGIPRSSRGISFLATASTSVYVVEAPGGTVKVTATVSGSLGHFLAVLLAGLLANTVSSFLAFSSSAEQAAESRSSSPSPSYPCLGLRDPLFGPTTCPHPSEMAMGPSPFAAPDPRLALVHKHEDHTTPLASQPQFCLWPLAGQSLLRCGRLLPPPFAHLWRSQRRSSPEWVFLAGEAPPAVFSGQSSPPPDNPSRLPALMSSAPRLSPVSP